MLAETAMLVGRHEQAAALLDVLAGEAITDQERVDVADTRTIRARVVPRREHEALAVVDETLTLVHDPDLVDRLIASLAIVLVQAPKPGGHRGGPPAARSAGESELPSCAYAASVALALSGALERAIEVARSGHEAHVAIGAAVHFLPETQFIGAVLALCGAGRAVGADELVVRGYDAAVRAQHADLQASFALLGRVTAVHRGRLTTAGASSERRPR